VSLSNAARMVGQYDWAGVLLRSLVTRRLVAVLSCHLPFRAPLDGFASVLSQSHSLRSVADAVVICGDFNTEDRIALSGLAPELREVNVRGLPTCLNPSNCLVSIDYIWHSPSLAPVQFSTEPDTSRGSSRLLAHSSAADHPFSDYFSDHAILRARFHLSSGQE
jgi:endonuclease/exonuclease/phosphatase (EEP) superfamily protein YafD